MGADAFALVLASALLHAWWSVSIKGSRDPLVFNALQTALPLAGLLAALPAVDLAEIPPRAWTYLAATTLCHTGYFWWLSRAFEHGDLTLVYPIARSTPAFLPLVAVPLLGERLSAAGVAGIATVVAGMWLVQLGPGLRRGTLGEPATRYALLTLATTVGYSLFDKAAMAELAAVPWSGALPRAVFWNLALWSSAGCVFSALVALRRGLPTLLGAARADLATPSRAAAVSLVGYALILQAFTLAPSSYVVAVRQTSVLFALVLGVLRLRERPGRLRIAGAVATVAGVALIAVARP